MSENVKIVFNFLFHKFSSALAWETGYFLCFSTFPNLGVKEDLPKMFKQDLADLFKQICQVSLTQIMPNC